MQKLFVTLVVCGLLAASAGQASAQVGSAWTDRAYFNLNWAGQSGSTDLNGTSTFTLYEEEARLTATSTAEAGPMIDFSVGARVWRNVSVGIAFHRVSSKSDASVDGSIPHPLFFNRPRTFTQTVSDLKRNEHAVHLQFGYMIPLNEKLDILVYGGPSFFSVSQDVISSVNVGEGPGAATVVAQPVVSRQKDSPVGGHFGADVSYKLYTIQKVKLGVGGFFRVAKASSSFRVLDTDVDSDVGGAQGGFGLRVRF
jgi:hypothetical protein